MIAQYSDIIIIGAGLTGLTLAYLLKQTKHTVTILEGRHRVGGRIHTLYPAGEPPQDMGATWLGMKHLDLVDLIQELNLDIFPQEMGDKAIYEPMSINPPQLVQLPANHDPSYRIKGGSSHIIKSLASKLTYAQILTNQVVKCIKLTGDRVEVESARAKFSAARIVSTLPPYLLFDSIQMEPSLPKEISDIGRQTHTWMGASIKVSLVYDRPFWQSEGTSGTIFSHVGPITEMYDHSDIDNKRYALKGFMNSHYYSLNEKARRQLILQQLIKYYGEKAATPLAYHEIVWSQEVMTYREYKSHVLPHQNNGHAAYRYSYWDGKLILAGTETSARHPGYMDGAVGSAKYIFNQLKEFK